MLFIKDLGSYGGCWNYGGVWVVEDFLKDLTELWRILSWGGFSNGFNRIGEDFELWRIF